MKAVPITVNELPLGAHQSIAGGTPKAVERGLEVGCRVLQIFVKNSNRWVGRPIDRPEARAFRSATRGAGLARVMAHTSYLINLASPVAELSRRSIEALIEEIERCQRLGIPDLVLHPGARTAGKVNPPVWRIAASLDDDFDRTAGLSRLAAIHMNDSKKPRGSRADRHEHIGRGTIGRRGFRNLMTDPRLAAIPKFLETPKDDTLDFDRKNLATLRRLAL